MTPSKFKRLATQMNLKPTTKSYKAVEAVMLGGRTITEACKEFSISQQMVHMVVRAFKTTPVNLTDAEKALHNDNVDLAYVILNDLFGEYDEES